MILSQAMGKPGDLEARGVKGKRQKEQHNQNGWIIQGRATGGRASPAHTLDWRSLGARCAQVGTEGCWENLAARIHFAMLLSFLVTCLFWIKTQQEHLETFLELQTLAFACAWQVVLSAEFYCLNGTSTVESVVLRSHLYSGQICEPEANLIQIAGQSCVERL